MGLGAGESHAAPLFSFLPKSSCSSMHDRVHRLPCWHDSCESSGAESICACWQCWCLRICVKAASRSSNRHLVPQEMYAFTLACYNEGMPKVHLHKKMMSQPPWDSGALIDSPKYCMGIDPVLAAA